MMKKFLGIFFFVFIVLRISAFPQTTTLVWVVPEEVKEKVCPFHFTPETVKSGENIFQKNCKSCHGDP